ncbi:hypothetical protein V8B97DRAFT_1915132 [Scleroderma yunnanense]
MVPKKKNARKTQLNLPSRGFMTSNSSGGSNDVSLSKKLSTKKQKELCGDHNNALKILERHAGIHYKPVVQSTLKHFDQIKDAYLIWAGCNWDVTQEPKNISPAIFSMKYWGKGPQQKCRAAYKCKSGYILVWIFNNILLVREKFCVDLIKYHQILSLLISDTFVMQSMLQNVFFWIISNSEGGPDVQVVLQWEFNKNMHLSEARSSNISTLALEQVDMDGVLSLLELADNYNACEEKFMDLFEHPKKISKFLYKVEVKKSMAT